MPGILGVVGQFANQRRANLLARMVEVMEHEQFYRSGTHVEERASLGAGWVCHENSFADGQPFWSEARDIAMFFSGECFGLAEENRSIKHHSEPWSARHLLALYERRGISFLENLNGWFSGLIIDLRINKVFLFNDRFGLNRIYWHRAADSFYFSSEAKSLLRVLPQLRRIEPECLVEQFSCGCVLQDRTLFTGIGLLPAGSVWTLLENGNFKRERYFRPATWEAQPRLDPQSYYLALRETFPRVLARYLRGGLPVAMSLTGGLDGRMIMASAARKPGSLACFTFGGMFRDCMDVKLARRVARCCEQSHRVIHIDGNFLDKFPSMAARSIYLSDGTMDVTGSVELYANRLARQIAPVRLTGNYGSEILRRNVAFRPGAAIPEFLSSDLWKSISGVAKTYQDESQCPKPSFIAFKQVPWHHYSRLSIEQSQVALRSPFLDNDLVGLAFRAPDQLASSPAPALQFISDANPALGAIPTDRGLTHRANSMLNGTRRLWQETTARTEYMYDYGMPQWLAGIDNVFSAVHLERLFLGRHKFYHFRVWYRDRLADYVKSVLLDSKSLSRPYLQRSAVEQVVQAHLTGRRNHTREIHQLLSTELTYRQLIEQQ